MLFGAVGIGPCYFDQGLSLCDDLGEAYRAQSVKENLRLFDLPANRGDIYDCQMNLLASSVPMYELRIDFGVQTMEKSAFDRQVDELASGLADIFPDVSRLLWKTKLIQARFAKNPNRYWLLRKGVSFGTLAQVRKLPMLKDESTMRRLGRNSNQPSGYALW